MMILLTSRSLSSACLILSLLLLPVGAIATSLSYEERIADAKELLLNAGYHDICQCGSQPPMISWTPEEDTSFNVRSLDYTSAAWTRRAEEEMSGPKDTAFFVRNGIFAFACVCTAALAAGLTLGLLSLDPLNLLIKMRTASTEAEKKQAASLLPIVRQHHLLLVTLLLLNSLSNEALPLFLDKIVPSYVAIILSVTFVLFFGEIIPSAIFTGPHQIRIASNLVPLLRVVMCLLYPISFPIAKMLDIFLHDEDEESGFNRGELSALVKIQYEERIAAKQRRKRDRLQSVRLSDTAGLTASSIRNASIRHAKREIAKQTGNATPNSSLTPRTVVANNTLPLAHQEDYMDLLGSQQSLHFDEVTMIQGALEMKTKRAMDVYTPLRDVFTVSIEDTLTESNIVRLYSSGFSRVPVIKPRPGKPKDRTGIVGILLTKHLIVVNTDDNRPVSTLPLQMPKCVSPTLNLVDLINLFQSPEKSMYGGHLALVCARPLLAQQALDKGGDVPSAAGLMGLVTLEDCLEELLQEEIYDETDRMEIATMKSALWAWRKWRLFVKKKKIQREERALAEGHEPAILDVVRLAHDRAERGETTPLMGRASSDKTIKPFFGIF